MPPLAEIAPAAEEHLAAISALAGLIWRAYYPTITSTEQIEYMLGWMYSLETMTSEVRNGIRYERLLLDGELAGFASLGPADEPGTVKLHKLYLVPKYHGEGFGTLLLKHCESEARKLDARIMTLNVNKRNARAIAVYQRNGFSIARSVVNDIGHGFVMDDYVMIKQLT
ncbi:MAG TPA: GNAT family N-acetyltransferase [Verrucomicrobiae bacterium]|nr:GNAT family N-acetyltransferase [Verrucomicrobiae bacterium]